MTAQEYLQQIENLEISIRQDIELLNRLKNNVCGSGAIDYSADRVQTSTTGDSLCKTITNYVDFEKRIEQKRKKFDKITYKIMGEIRVLHNKNYIQILFKVYVQYKSLSQTAKEMNMSYNYATSQHRKALKAFQELHKNLVYYSLV